MWIRSLLFTVLLAVLAESLRGKMDLKITGSPKFNGYKPLKIHSNYIPEDSGRNVLSNSQVKVENVTVYSTGVSVIHRTRTPNNSLEAGKAKGTPQKHRETWTLETPKVNITNDIVYVSMKDKRPRRKDGLVGSKPCDVDPDREHSEDSKIDPDFEHLPALKTTKIDPEFEQQPNADLDYYFPGYDWQYDFPTLKESGAGIPIKQNANSHSETLNSDNLSDEEYYFDYVVDDDSASTTNAKKAIEDIGYLVTDLQNTSNSTEQQQTTTDPGEITSKMGTNATTKSEIPNDLTEHADEYDYDLGNDLIHHSLKNLFFDNIDDKFRSLVFNPVATPHEKFQECTTPRNESGHCRYVQHCFLPNIIASLGSFMGYVCVIEERYIGICCPEFPVHSLEVDWKLPLDQMATDENSTQPDGGCGISSRTRIVGGSKADPKEWPWMAALLSKSRGRFFCGGSLINSKYVLTAAHCTFSVPQNQILVRLGEYDFSDTNDGPGEDYPVIEIKRHARYSRKTLRNDIALLKLARPAKFGPFVGTICLPEGNIPYVGQMATLAGWGNIKGGGPTSAVLLEASFPVWSNIECSNAQGIQIRKTSICAGAREKDKGACNGDSGGPLMLLDESTKRWKVIGIVSWGRRGCDTNYPTVFARTSKYLMWIKAHSSD